jgi:hypothetical protein
MEEIQELALTLMKQFGLTDWTFGWCRSKKSLGLCKDGVKKILLSKYFCKIIPFDEIENTIRHEIAHALIGPHKGHDQEWKNACKLTGANPTRCYKAQIQVPGKYQAKCKCNIVHHKHRMDKKIKGYCKHCKQILKFKKVTGGYRAVCNCDKKSLYREPRQWKCKFCQEILKFRKVKS